MVVYFTIKSESCISLIRSRRKTQTSSINLFHSDWIRERLLPLQETIEFKTFIFKTLTLRTELKLKRQSRQISRLKKQTFQKNILSYLAFLGVACESEITLPKTFFITVNYPNSSAHPLRLNQDVHPGIDKNIRNNQLTEREKYDNFNFVRLIYTFA